jgi:serine/threonine protein kinase
MSPEGSSVATSGPAVPRYRTLFPLGHGGMGSVEAVAEELNDGTTRVVALKRLLRAANAPGADAPQIEMFLREARLTTLLDHPNVIRSFAFGETAGEVFLAMEYIAGEPLSHLLSAAARRGSRLPLPVVAYILAEACEGLHAAHELAGDDDVSLGVVHRDVSPHNVMVGYDGAVKLLDFGVAKVDLIDCAARTKTGEVKGKTAYMSPEQAMGDAVDRRSDLYSIGVVLFECIAGQRMWGGGTDLDILRKLALEEPPSLTELAPGAPVELVTLYARLVGRDRETRPSTAKNVAIALRSYVASAGASVDAGVVRATMSQLFEGVRERREEALARALASTSSEAATPGPSATGAGESGPVFVTHRAPATRQSRRFSPVAVSASLILAACALGGFGVLASGAGREDRRGVETGNAPASSGLAQTITPMPAAATSSTAQPPAMPSATPSSPAVEGRVAPRREPRLMLDRTMHRPLDSRPTPAPTPRAAPSSSAAPHVVPLPPDVDPTPF